MRSLNNSGFICLALPFILIGITIGAYALTFSESSVDTGYLPFEDMGRGFFSGWRYPAGVVIKTQEDLIWTWGKHYSNSLYPPVPPEIDFDSDMLIFVFRGNFPSWGYTTEVAKLRIAFDGNNRYLQITVIQSNPKRGSFLKQDFIQPYQLIKCRREALTVRFRYITYTRLR